MALLEQTSMHLGRIGRRILLLGNLGHAFADSLLKIEKGDSLLMLAYGRVHSKSVLAQHEIRRHGGKVVVVTDNVSGKRAGRADCVVEIPRTEVGNMTMYGLALNLTGDDPLPRAASKCIYRSLSFLLSADGCFSIAAQR